MVKYNDFGICYVGNCDSFETAEKKFRSKFSAKQYEIKSISIDFSQVIE